MLLYATIRGIFRTTKKVVKKVFLSVAKHELLFKVIMVAFFAYGMYNVTGMTAYMQNYNFLHVAIGLITIPVVAIPYFKGLKVISENAKKKAAKKTESTPENTPETNE